MRLSLSSLVVGLLSSPPPLLVSAQPEGYEYAYVTFGETDPDVLRPGSILSHIVILETQQLLHKLCLYNNYKIPTCTYICYDLLIDTRTASGDQFGRVVALWKDRVAISSNQMAVNDNQQLGSSGKVYLFHQDYLLHWVGLHNESHYMHSFIYLYINSPFCTYFL